MSQRSVPIERINAALQSLHHRGPDGSGVWSSGNGQWCLGHTRLSIIGLNNGEQPMTSQDGQTHLVVNGEFYGYQDIRQTLQKRGCQFATDSDSEIALHLYQEQGMLAAQSLRGEFAAIIADEREQVMIAVRDRFGIKPLYYAIVNGDVVFASEIKTLKALGVPMAWNFESISGGLFNTHENAIFDGVHSVPQGCYAIAKDGQVRIYPYWDWDIPTAQEMAADSRSEDEVVGDFRSALLDAVDQRLVADVEVACYLSGGIDSCAVLGLAQQARKEPIRAFTLTFDDPLYNEAAIAKAQAAHVGASYHPIPISGGDIADAFSDAVWHAEPPMFNGHGLAKFLLSRAVRDAGIKVVFTGEGADEMLGGYPFFRMDAILHNPAYSPAQRKALIDELFGANKASRAIMMPEHTADPSLDALRNRLGWLPAMFNVQSGFSQSIGGFYQTDFVRSVAQHNPVAMALDRLPLARQVHGRDHLNQALYINSKLNLPNMILTFLGDRMEMAHSIEGRLPFLDHRVAEVAARVPVGMKVKGMREKHVLREAAKDVLIPEVYDRQKHPFQSPPTRDEKDPMMAFYRDTFSSDAARAQPIYDMGRAMTAVDELLDSPADQRIAVEGVLQRIASIVVLQDRFGMSAGA
jgi:asparagine synthase (glutamine-hydrolysing)